MKKTLLALVFLGAASIFAVPASAANVAIGVSFGAPPPPVVVYSRPPMPGPGYAWVDGYWYPNAGRWAWRTGYWERAPFVNAAWVAPRYSGGRYYQGYWGRGDRDRDGIPNRYDRFDNRFAPNRFDNRRFDRDRDGIPNRYDRFDNHRFDRDHDGIPNRYDRHDNRRNHFR